MTDLRPDIALPHGDEAVPPGANGEHRSFIRSDDDLDEVREQTDTLVATLRRALNARTRDARDWASERADQAREAVQERPATAILGALAAGLIVGLLAGGR